MKILFFGDGPWATDSLLRLHEAGWTIQGVVIRTRPTDSSLAEAAKRLGLEVWQPPNVNRQEFVEQVAQLNPELCLSVSYDQILGRAIRQVAPQGMVNFHAGKLPFYRGRSIINWAIINGETEIGLTAHYVDEGIDTGDIILQRTLPIGWTETYGDVLAKVVFALPDLVVETVNQMADGRAQRQPQSHLPGSYFAARGTGDEWLDWSESSRNLHNKVRAITHPGPGSRTLLENRVVIIWRGFYDPSWPSYIGSPGQVVGRRKDEGVLVKTADSTILLQEAQFEGDEASYTPDWPIGTRLGINLMQYLYLLENRMASS
jgi:methionyl-tRNA formyltransferase